LYVARLLKVKAARENLIAAFDRTKGPHRSMRTFFIVNQWLEAHPKLSEEVNQNSLQCHLIVALMAHYL